jgi:hypothetical protein
MMTRCKMTNIRVFVKELVDFINVFQILHLDTIHDSWPHWTDHNPYTPTTQTLLE